MDYGRKVILNTLMDEKQINRGNKQEWTKNLDRKQGMVDYSAYVLIFEHNSLSVFLVNL